jgi:hypothetical protein
MKGKQRTGQRCVRKQGNFKDFNLFVQPLSEIAPGGMVNDVMKFAIKLYTDQGLLTRLKSIDVRIVSGAQRRDLITQYRVFIEQATRDGVASAEIHLPSGLAFLP